MQAIINPFPVFNIENRDNEVNLPLIAMAQLCGTSQSN
jgi:hypothetical protein